MSKVTIEGAHPFDGEYELESTETYSGHELRLVKKVSGVRLGEIEEAAKAGDYDLFVALAVIAMWRAGKITKDEAPTVVEQLLNLPAGKIKFEDEPAEGDASPPAQAPIVSGATTNGGESSKRSSTDSSSTSDALPETTRVSTGPRG